MSRICKDISGAILAGGQSARMGTPKYLLKVKGKRIIDTTLDVLRGLFGEVLIVTDDKRRFSGFGGVKVVEDIVKGQGPLGGIYAGLKASSQEHVFFAACDMPFLHIGLIRRLIEASQDDELDCVVPVSSDGTEPLYGVYSKKALRLFEAFFKETERSARRFLTHCNCKHVEAKGDELSAFININTPDDLEEAQSNESKIQDLD